MLARELSNPKFKEYHIFFSNILPSKDMLQTLADADESDDGPLVLLVDAACSLRLPADVVAARGTLGSNRDVFFVELIGFDTHSDMDATLSGLLGDVNDALGSFVAEMKAQGTWGNVTIVSASDFGRTLTSNGLGTDHAWGGNHFVAGGSVKGGQVFGQYISITQMIKNIIKDYPEGTQIFKELLQNADDAKARELVKRDGVEMKYYDVIYHLTEEIAKEMAGELGPERIEHVVGRAAVKEVFRSGKKDKAAGLLVEEGVIRKGLHARLTRDDVIVSATTIASLRRFKDDVDEVRAGLECGVVLADTNDIKPGDQLEVYEVNEEERTL